MDILVNHPDIRNTTYTENGELSCKQAPTSLVAFLKGATRGVNENTFIELIDDAYQTDPLKTLRLIVNLRDRGGKGERDLGRIAFHRFSQLDAQSFIKNLWSIKEFGRIDDLFYLAKRYMADPTLFNNVIKYIAELLYQDCKIFENARKFAQDENKNMRESQEFRKEIAKLSLAGKWVKRERKSLPISLAIANQLNLYLPKFSSPHNVLLEFQGMTTTRDIMDDKVRKRANYALQKYRKLLSNLNRLLETPEVKMCGNKWDDIDFNKVAGACMSKCEKAFQRHCPTRFEEYMIGLMQGKLKVNGKCIMPHELVRKYLDTNTMKKKKNIELNPIVEAQFKLLCEDLKKKIEQRSEGASNESTIVVCDVSGSMYSGDKSTRPIDVSIALTILFSLCNEGYYHRKALTFSSRPSLVNIEGDTLFEMVNSLKHIEWGMTTNLVRTMNVLFDVVKGDPENSPKRVIIITDGQFDKMSDTMYSTTLEKIQKLYEGYNIPEIVFWNVNGKYSDFATDKDEDGIAMISGFSPDIIKYLTNDEKGYVEIDSDGEEVKRKPLTPSEVVERIVNDPKYSKVELA